MGKYSVSLQGYLLTVVNYGDMLLLDVPSLMAGSTTLVFPGYGVYQAPEYYTTKAPNYYTESPDIHHQSGLHRSVQVLDYNLLQLTIALVCVILLKAGSTTGALMSPGYGRYQITTSCHTSQQRGLQVLNHCGTEYYKTMYAATFYYTKAPNPLLVVY
ncbi:hypothetical protein DAPPUDRAFT_117857 [Daphnia pulex]|uniref:Uncharacterized protein n=1 Tax=Daphnia pulex TaxID=6669 RepID=E9HTZ1_DAPPU|nr:hypothetical protein DAPPUDRAFT_117857 [Daphnia pulex]|eukprot:EFX64790.1 hypothetical protein DAPPUDRAFT_117857 [Daphnia pulex]